MSETTTTNSTHEEAMAWYFELRPEMRSQLMAMVADGERGIAGDWCEDNGGERRFEAALSARCAARNLSAFARSYTECALWSSHDEGGAPLDDAHGIDDIAPECLLAMVADCKAFQEEHGELFAENPWRAGQDFWLSRNGHGAGFWDGDWANGTELHRAAKAYGSVDLYVGDDGLVYGHE